MRRAWVIDHPAHARLLAPLMRELASAEDVIIACERKEVRAMIEYGDGHLPRRRTIWVPRAIGKGRYRKALARLFKSKRALKGFDQVISIGAPLEIRAAPKSAQRIYITDTEVNHLAHKLARNRATDIVIPNHFREDLSGPLLRGKARIHRIDGLHGHVHLRPSLRPRVTSSPPRILLRRLRGDGIHDRNEIKTIAEDWLSSFDITLADEDEFTGDPWSLDSLIASMDGVITQSTTLASEAVLLGVPTLLVSNAQRGFLDALGKNNLLIRNDFAAFKEHLHQPVESDSEWPDTRQQLTQIIENL
jgi:predicted glycosyltransferase